MARVLVVGGAGYVGSATCASLLDSGHEVWVLDNLSTGFRSLFLGHRFVLANAGDRNRVLELAKQVKFDCVMHFAALSQVGESFKKSDLYFENNVLQTQALVEALIEGGVQNFIFSSTCSIFGEIASKDGKYPPIHEKMQPAPQNPYGKTKWEVEKILFEKAAKKKLRSIALRYFNAAGAEPQLRVGESHDPETHLIPKVLQAARTGDPIHVYGTDYPTPDGTCIRDYIHVSDLARAHLLAMEKLLAAGSQDPYWEAFHLGSEKGYSVMEIIQTCERVTGKAISWTREPRRKGDVPCLVADSSRARQGLGWGQNLHGLESQIQSAWKWEQKKGSFERKAVFLDRDGTLNVDPGYLSDPNQLVLLDGVAHSLAALKEAGYLLIVVSNQSGVGRGLIQPQILDEIHLKMNGMLKPECAQIDYFACCIHHPDENCECRKPKPKLLLDLAKTHRIRLDQSYMIGDKIADLLVGRAAGCRGSLLVRTGEGKNTELKAKSSTPDGLPADFIGDSLPEVVTWILDRENANSS